MEPDNRYIAFKDKKTGEYLRKDNTDDILCIEFEAFKEKMIPIQLTALICGYELIDVEKIKETSL
jgi:hypothetical protein|nr:MAG TPA: hypothetical protein [Caudoviricetes sp.]